MTTTTRPATAPRPAAASGDPTGLAPVLGAALGGLASLLTTDLLVLQRFGPDGHLWFWQTPWSAPAVLHQAWITALLLVAVLWTTEAPTPTALRRDLAILCATLLHVAGTTDLPVQVFLSGDLAVSTPTLHQVASYGFAAPIAVLATLCVKYGRHVLRRITAPHHLDPATTPP